MKRFIITFFISAFFTGVFLFGFHQSDQDNPQKYSKNSLIEAAMNSKDAGQKEDTWVYGIKTDFDAQEIKSTNIDKAAMRFYKQFEKEGLVTDMQKGKGTRYVFGVDEDQRYGKAVMLIKNGKNSILVIPSTHILKDDASKKPPLPSIIQDIFDDIDFNKTTYSYSPDRKMLSFTYNDAFGRTVHRIRQTMEQEGYMPQELKDHTSNNGILIYFTKGNMESFFQVTPVNKHSLQILYAEYPR